MVQAIPKENVLRDIHGLWQHLDQIPSVTDYKEHGKYSIRPIYTHFDGFVDARKQAGVHDSHLRHVSKEEILSRIRELYDKLGREPSVVEYQEQVANHTGYFAKYGGFRQLKEEAGVYEGRFNNQELTREEIIVDLQRAATKADGVLSINEYQKHGRYTVKTVQNYFDSWVQGRAAAGLTQESLLYRTGVDHPNSTGHNYSIYKTDSWYRNQPRARHRDNNQCVHCGMTNQEHREKYGRALHVHHTIPSHFGVRDGDVVDESVNTLSNLVTLCEKHHIPLWEGLFASPKEMVRLGN